MQNTTITSLQIIQLNCKDEETSQYSSQLVEKSDLKIRAIEWNRRNRDSARIVWFVLNRIQDISSFHVIISKGDNIITNVTLDYLTREYVVSQLEEYVKYKVCINSLDSLGKARQTFDSQCALFDSETTFSANFNNRHSLNESLKAKSGINSNISFKINLMFWQIFVLIYSIQMIKF